MNIYIDNTNLLELFRLKSAVENTYINDATVTVTLKDEAGTEVTGQTWPLTLTYVPSSNGDYRGIISEDCEFTEGEPYYAIIEANAGVNRYGHWEIQFVPKVRRM